MKKSKIIMGLVLIFLISSLMICSAVEANTYLLSHKDTNYKNIINSKFNYDTKNLKIVTGKGNSNSIRLIIILDDVNGRTDKNIPLDGNEHEFDLSEVRIEKGEHNIIIQDNTTSNTDIYLSKTLTLHFTATETTGSKSLADGIGRDGSGSDTSTGNNNPGTVNGIMSSVWDALTGKNNNSNSNGLDNRSNDSNNKNNSSNNNNNNNNNNGGGLDSLSNNLLLIIIILAIIFTIIYIYYKKTK